MPSVISTTQGLLAPLRTQQGLLAPFEELGAPCRLTLRGLCVMTPRLCRLASKRTFGKRRYASTPVTSRITSASTKIGSTHPLPTVTGIQILVRWGPRQAFGDGHQSPSPQGVAEYSFRKGFLAQSQIGSI